MILVAFIFVSSFPQQLRIQHLDFLSSTSRTMSYPYVICLFFSANFTCGERVYQPLGIRLMKMSSYYLFGLVVWTQAMHINTCKFNTTCLYGKKSTASKFHLFNCKKRNIKKTYINSGRGVNCQSEEKGFPDCQREGRVRHVCWWSPPVIDEVTDYHYIET